MIVQREQLCQNEEESLKCEVWGTEHVLQANPLYVVILGTLGICSELKLVTTRVVFLWK